MLEELNHVTGFYAFAPIGTFAMNHLKKISKYWQNRGHEPHSINNGENQMNKDHKMLGSKNTFTNQKIKTRCQPYPNY